jgi:hypothetical protein
MSLKFLCKVREGKYGLKMVLKQLGMPLVKNWDAIDSAKFEQHRHFKMNIIYLNIIILF